MVSVLVKKSRKSTYHDVDILRNFLPGTFDISDLGRNAKVAFGADFMCHIGHFSSENVKLKEAL